MTHCPDSTRIQDYLDEELVPAERVAFEAHLAGCAPCKSELAIYARVFSDIESLPLLSPSADLVDRVLAEVMPAHSARWARAAMWAYGTAFAASIASIAAAVFLPGPRQWTYTLAADAARSLITSFLFVLKSLNAAALRVVDLAQIAAEFVGRLGPILRALRLPLSQPIVLLTVSAAVIVCVALFWWMRPRETPSEAQGEHHVGILGF